MLTKREIKILLWGDKIQRSHNVCLVLSAEALPEKDRKPLHQVLPRALFICFCGDKCKKVCLQRFREILPEASDFCTELREIISLMHQTS
jgi:hypothetical protein